MVRPAWRFCTTVGSAVSLLAVLAAGCTEDSSSPSGPDDPDPVVEWATLDCDPIAPSYCGFPFPSNVFTTADPASPTGRRLKLSAVAMPVSYYGQAVDNTAWDRLDGFSTSGGILVHLPGATSAGLPTVFDIETSLSEDSPTILLDTETGERVAHFAELDATANDPTRAPLFIRPAQALENNRRYIVAIAGIVDASGEPLEASAGFAALRDGTPIEDEPTVEDRRPLYTDIFTRLTDLGVERGQLQLAWDFTTASDEGITGPLVHMRDESFAMLGDGTPTFTIDEAQEDFDPRVAYRITGTFEVPLYLDSPGPVSVMNLGSDGLPEPTRNEPFDFELIIPASAADQPAKLLQYGHGLLGLPEEVEREHLLDFANDRGYALFSTTWLGLAKPDEAFLGAIFDGGRLEEFDGVFARNQQAVLNALWLNRMMTRGMAQDPTYGRYLDASQNYYYGISLGGILGTLYMSLSPDVTRAAVDVMGAPFNLLLTRSALFDPFFSIARSTYEDPRDIAYGLGLLQLFWDRAEPNGFVRHVRDEPFAGTPSHELLMRGALGDHAVNNAGAQYLARSVGVPHVDTGLRELYGLTTVPDGQGFGYVEYDFGLPMDPACDLPQRQCKDPHGALRGLPAADEQLDQFLRTGNITNTCGGACVFPEIGMCPGGEPNGMCLP
jgi:hypothetical protein